MKALLNRFVEEKGNSKYNLEVLRKSEKDTIYRLDMTDETFIYRVHTIKSAKAVNEILALRFLEREFPSEEFYPKIICSNNTEIITKYLAGNQSFPFELNITQIKNLGRVFNTLVKKTPSSYYTIDRLDIMQRGSAYNISSDMITGYAIPKFNLLAIRRPSFSRMIRKNIEKILCDNQKVLQDCRKFNFFHYDLVDNIVVDGGQPKLIDWEKSGFGDPAYNLAVMVIIGKFSSLQENKLQEEFKGFKDDTFSMRYKFYKTLGLVINFLWLYNKKEIEKIYPESIWELNELESKMMEVF